MLTRLALVLMLCLLPLQWSLAQAHDSAEEIGSVAQALVVAGAAPLAAAEPAAHSQEPGGTCEFHELAHTLALVVDDVAALPLADRIDDRLSAAADARLALGVPSAIERPRWPHHGSSVVVL